MKNNKRQLIKLIFENNTSQKVEIIDEEQNMFQHEEADVSIISYLFFLIHTGEVKQIQDRCDDTDIFLFCCISTGIKNLMCKSQ